ncbi:MAG: hemolysin family protein [Anaerolineae bacterium]
MELLILFFLTLLNGLLAMSEAAVISANKVRLQQRAMEGDIAAQAALDLASNPNKFLSTVQIGITLIGIMAGAFGGAALSGDAAALFARVPFLEPYSDVLGVAGVVALTTYLSLVVGELVPKRLAIRYAERISMSIAPVMKRLSLVTYPIVVFLSISTEAVLRLLGVQAAPESPVTEEEINVMLRDSARAGVIEIDEQEMVAGVFRLDDLRVEAIMTPRTEMTYLNTEDTPEEIHEVLVKSASSRFPVVDGSPDHIVGVVRTKDLLNALLLGQPLDLRAAALRPVFVPESSPVSDVLRLFRQDDLDMVFVLGEHGGTEGLVTLTDIVEAVVGDIGEPDAVRRADGSWLVDGLMPVEEFKELVGIRDGLPQEEYNLYRTLAGFFMTHQGAIPKTSDSFYWGDFYFEVVDMDGLRIDKVLIQRRSEEGQTE